MTEPREFRPLQAEEIARAFQEEGVDYLFIDLPLLESFRAEYEKLKSPPLRSAADVAAERKQQ
jgi:hypothetical protein